MNLKDKTILWKDKYNWLHYIYIVYVLIALILVLYAFSQSQNFLGVLCLILAFYLFWSILRLKLTYITKEGIRIGNIVIKKKAKFIFRPKANFIVWKQIKSLSLISRGIYGPWGGGQHIILILTKINGEKYECEIFRLNEFLQTLKKLGKANLIAKDSKYK